MKKYIPIPNFENYGLCIDKFIIKNRDTDKVLKPQLRTGTRAKYYKLYSNGVPVTMSLFQILCLIFDRELF